jgi:hypothetical protein
MVNYLRQQSSEVYPMIEKKIVAPARKGGGLVRAILNDPSGGFAARAITRDVNDPHFHRVSALPPAVHSEENSAHHSNGAYVENVAGAPEWQRLLCPCRPNKPYKFRLTEKTRVQLVSHDDSQLTHFLPRKPIST